MRTKTRKQLKNIMKNRGPKTMTVATWLPVFTGYYHSIFCVDDAFIERELELSDDELREYYSEVFEAGVSMEFFRDNFWYYCNFKETMEECSRMICDGLLSIDHAEIITNIKYEKTVSPKYYNFSTDSINCEITVKINKLKRYLGENLEEFTAYIKDKYTSRDGFSSWYSNNINDWLDVESYGSHELGSVLNFVCFNESEDADIDLYYESNCYESTCYYQILDVKKMIADYKEKQAA